MEITNAVLSRQPPTFTTNASVHSGVSIHYRKC